MRLPVGLRHELIEFLFSDEIFDYKIFFGEFEKYLKYSLILSMYPRIFEEKTPVIKGSTVVDEIYIIKRGRVLLTSVFGNSFLALGEKSFIGEELVLFNKVAKIDFVADLLGVECFCIKKSKYLDLLSKYPKSFRAVLRRAFKRGKYFKAVIQRNLERYELKSTDSMSLLRTVSMKEGADDFINNFS